MENVSELRKEREDFMKKAKEKEKKRNTWTPNDILVYDTHAEILIRNNKQELVGISLIDLDYIPIVRKYKWHMIRKGKYVGTHVNENDEFYEYAGKNELVLHRLIAKAKKGEIVDHKNRDKLDNRNSNLRIVTTKENLANVERRGLSPVIKMSKRPDLCS